ncbi:MAG: S8 family serine peptidase [candidate division WOR-3 bacterium]
MFFLIFSFTIKLAQGEFDPLKGLPGWVYEKPYYRTISEAGFYGFIQFNGPITLSQRNYLENLGIKIEEYYSDYTYLVKFKGENIYNFLSSDKPNNIRALFLYQPAFKIHPSVYTVQYKTPELRNDPWRYLEVELFLDADVDYVANFIKENFGAEIIEIADLRNITRILRLIIHVDPIYIEEIAQIPEVKWIVPYTEKFILNDANRWVHQTNVQVDTLIWRKGIRGENQILCIMDSGVDVNHCFFNGTVPGGNKIVGYRAYGDNTDGCTTGHGTHVAGTAAGGDDNISPNQAYKGMAPRARIYVQDVQTTSTQNCLMGSLDAVPDPIYPAFQDAYNNGARVHTNSWGGGTNSYDSYARDEDLFMWDYPDFLILFAAGNASSAGQSNAQNISNNATAKNIITVGSLARAPNQEVKAYYSSEGPTQSGRWKPDIMACGGDDRFNGYTNSADNGTQCGIQGNPFEGTSMATPVVAGSALLTRQWLITYFGYISPPASLIKAVLLAGTQFVLGTGEPNPGPDYGWPSNDVGWGRVNLRNSFGIKNSSDTLLVREGSLTTGAKDSFWIKVINNLDPLRIVLTYTDYPSAANSTGSIVNNIDLKMVDPNNLVYWGNNIDRTNRVSQSGGTPDNVNNVEVIHLSPSMLVVNGVYKIVVYGTNIPQPGTNGQRFSIAITGDVRFYSQTGSYLSLMQLVETVEGVKIIVNFGEERGVSGKLVRKVNGEEKVIFSGFLNNENYFEYLDRDVESERIYTYTFMAKLSSGEEIIYGPVKIKYKGKKEFEILKFSLLDREINLILSNPFDSEVDFNIIDEAGRKKSLLKVDLKYGVSSLKIKIPEDIKKGVYFLAIEGNKYSLKKKFVVYR